MRKLFRSSPNWYERSFNRDYLKLYSYKDSTAVQEVEGILKYLSLPARALAASAPKILDLACGWGRHAIELAARGYRVTGLDISEFMLEEAKRRAIEREVAVRWVQGDARQMKFKGEFDAVLNIFTSFGYFEDDRENVKVLEKVKQALVLDGQFLLDVDNPLHFIRTRQGLDTVYIQLDSGGREAVLKQEEFQFRGERRATYAFRDRRTSQDDLLLRCNLYNITDLKGLLVDQAGFELNPGIYGDFNGAMHPNHESEELDQGLPRLIVVARKAQPSSGITL